MLKNNCLRINLFKMVNNACSLCLSNNRKCVIINCTYLQLVYEKLTNKKIDNVSCRMCFICHRRLQQCHKLWQLAEHTRCTLLGLNVDKVHDKFDSTTSLLELSPSKVVNVSIPPTDEGAMIEIYVKREREDEVIRPLDAGVQHANTDDRTASGEIDEQASKSGTDDEYELKDEKLSVDESTLFEGNLEKNGQETDTEDSRGDENGTSLSADEEDEEPLTCIVRGQDLKSSGVNQKLLQNTKVLKLEVEKLSDSIISKYVCGISTTDSTCGHPRSRESVSAVCEYSPYDTEQNGTALEPPPVSTSKCHLRTRTCKICQLKFLGKRSLEMHMATHSDKPFSCDICQRSFSRKCILKVHLRSHTGEKPFSCDICHRKFSFKCNLTEHLRSHPGGKPFSCEICLCKFSYKRNLKSHLRNHTGEKPFSCDICQSKFSLRQHLKKHLHTHTGEEPLSCYTCQRKFFDKSSLKRHLKMHTDEKPFSCDICQCKFSFKSLLNRHLRSHSGEKPFSCDICHRKFSLKHHLKTHLYTHTGEKKFSCDFCQRKYSGKSALKRHLGSHTGEKPFSCDICQRKFSYKCDLKIHLRSHT